MPLRSPKVLAQFQDVGFVPPVTAKRLSWDDEREQNWHLPTGEMIHGPLPGRFGIRIRRQSDDAYNVALIWDSTYRQWFSLRRREIVSSDLEQILTALGVRFESLLDQPVGSIAEAA